jgi:hypothetical protein
MNIRITMTVHEHKTRENNDNGHKAENVIMIMRLTNGNTEDILSTRSAIGREK